MKLKLETLFRGYIFVLLVLLFWSVWAMAQSTATNTPSAILTNQPGALVKELTKLEGNYLTFGLDRVQLLSENRRLFT